MINLLRRLRLTFRLCCLDLELFLEEREKVIDATFRVLYGNNLTELHPDTFQELGNLTTLLLNSNKLRCIRKETFRKLRSLYLLSLYKNEIKSLASGTFDGMPNLTILHLALNPLICDCNLVRTFGFTKFYI